MLAITKQLHAGQDTAIQVGQPVTYDITVTNTGDITMAHVPLTDVFDSAVFCADKRLPVLRLRPASASIELDRPRSAGCRATPPR